MKSENKIKLMATAAIWVGTGLSGTMIPLLALPAVLATMIVWKFA